MVGGPDLRPVAPGETGELLLRSDQLSSGYWHNEPATNELFEGGWLHTGDLATIDAEGWIFFADRSKDMIKTGGENVYPAEVERVVRESGLVADVAVFGVPDPRWTETVKAVIVPNRVDGDGDGDVDVIAAIDRHCREHMAGYKRPRWYEVVERIPRNDTNKILKAQLRDAHDPDRSVRPPAGRGTGGGESVRA